MPKNVSKRGGAKSTTAWAAGGHAPPNKAGAKRIRAINAIKLVKHIRTAETKQEVTNLIISFGDHVPSRAEIRDALNKILK